ncbi:MAG: hypothetical protein FRX48_03947 [Lasallia pustulata]|uniref:DUF4246 domain-containing protein n=1 Tax=Lasallia pustulata TaxID=136370 RepID=A0A5M8PQQ3_9LECA|nr:MAG: hypothetical protein FRX48_03947 [Lasallia pustulata]
MARVAERPMAAFVPARRKHAIALNRRFCYTVRERTMLALINELTDIPDWDRKIFENDFTFKWKSEKLMSGKDITRSMADWCVEEVKYYVYNFLRSGVVPAIDGGVNQSNCRISSILKKELQKAITFLRR